MKVYDPLAFRILELDETTLSPEPGNYIPVRSVAGGWFALHMPTGISYRLSHLPEHAHAGVNNAIAILTVTERLREVSALVVEGVFAGARRGTRHTVERRYGAAAVVEAMKRLKEEGLAEDRLSAALMYFDSEPSDAKLLEGVEVLCVSDVCDG
jgi:hypothetical protein